jgi:hypothetical protein
MRSFSSARLLSFQTNIAQCFLLHLLSMVNFNSMFVIVFWEVHRIVFYCIHTIYTTHAVYLVYFILEYIQKVNLLILITLIVSLLFSRHYLM